jgi:hypothetical protein
MQQHTFLVDNDVRDITTCETCHAGSYNGYPCFSCHTQDEMGATHLQVGIEGGHENCVECHPTGREGAVANADSLSWQPYQNRAIQPAPAANQPKILPLKELQSGLLKNKTKQGQPRTGMFTSPGAAHVNDQPPAGRAQLEPGQNRSQAGLVSWTSGK